MADTPGIEIKMDEQMAKGVHGQDVLVTATDKDVCLTFYVRDPSGRTGFVTSRVFLPSTTAIQLAELIQRLLGPVYQKYLQIMKDPPPAASGQTSSDAGPMQ